MDSFTQIVLGAAAGEAVLGKKAGNKAPLWGAVAGTIPDLDVIANSFLNDIDGMAFHRGVSHSILFSVVFAPILGYMIYRFYQWRYAKLGKPLEGPNIPDFKDWTLLAFMGLFTHPILDCFTSWGTQLFWPFSDFRVAWNTIFVVDPLYTVPFAALLLLAMSRKRDDKLRKVFNWAGIGISSLYLLVTVYNKSVVDKVFEESFAAQNLNIERYESKPTPLNNVLWFIVGEAPEGYYLGYYSMLDSHKDIQFNKFEKRHELLEKWDTDPGMKTLKWINKGYYTVMGGDSADEYFLYDLRFGTANAFESPKPEFVFGFKVYPPENPSKGELTIVSQDPKVDNAPEMLGSLWKRIKGI